MAILLSLCTGTSAPCSNLHCWVSHWHSSSVCSCDVTSLWISCKSFIVHDLNYLLLIFVANFSLQLPFLGLKFTQLAGLLWAGGALILFGYELQCRPSKYSLVPRPCRFIACSIKFVQISYCKRRTHKPWERGYSKYQTVNQRGYTVDCAYTDHIALRLLTLHLSSGGSRILKSGVPVCTHSTRARGSGAYPPGKFLISDLLSSFLV